MHKKYIYFLLTSLALIYLPKSFAKPTQTKEFKSLQEFIHSTGGSNVSEGESAHGDINGDGIKDAILIIYYPGNELFEDSYRQLFVFIRKKNNMLSLVSSSQKSLTKIGSCCWVETLDIRNGTIVIKTMGAFHGSEIASHVFEPYQTTYRLKSNDYYYYQTCCDEQSDVSHEKIVDFIKGEIKHIKNEGKNRKEWKTTFKQTLFTMEDYDFSTAFGIPQNAFFTEEELAELEEIDNELSK